MSWARYGRDPAGGPKRVDGEPAIPNSPDQRALGQRYWDDERIEQFRRREAPASAWAYAVVVAGLWAIAEATHSYGWTIAAYVVSLPFGPVVEFFLLFAFSVLGFDPTTSIPAWQEATSVVVVVLAMGACGFLNVFATVGIVPAARERRLRRQGSR